MFPDVFQDTLFYETICKTILLNTVLILQHALGIHWSDYNITLRILPAGLRHTTLRIYCVFEMFEEYLLRRLKKHFQELFMENYGGVFYNNNFVESCIGFAACSRNALVRRHHYWGYW